MRLFLLPFCAIMLPTIAANHLIQASQPGESLRAVIPKAAEPPVIDGNLTEYEAALCTPIEYFHQDLRNRAAQFYYLWDDNAFYVGVRTLDEKVFAPSDPFWIGDAVEWYLDTRDDTIPARRSWGPGAVHCFFTPLTLTKVQPRFSLRPGYENAIPQEGILIAARKRDYGLEYEFKLPWSNFPKFRPAPDKILHLDAELSYSDGSSRSFRSFVFGGPLSVEQPANLAQAQLVNRFERRHWSVCGPVMMPIRVDVPWQQDKAPQVRAEIALPPNRLNEIGRILFQVRSTQGELLGEYVADEQETFQSVGGFYRRVAYWPVTQAPAGAYHVHAIVYDKDQQELARVAPRLISFNLEPGY